jgi:hypothetical protein
MNPVVVAVGGTCNTKEVLEEAFLTLEGAAGRMGLGMNQEKKTNI